MMVQSIVSEKMVLKACPIYCWIFRIFEGIFDTLGGGEGNWMRVGRRLCSSPRVTL